MKAAIYSGTRNLYPHMVTAAKSLVVNSSVEKIYFLVEDAEFPYEIPDMIETIDVSRQGFFNPKGPNMKTQFTYMALLRVCYTKLLPDVDKILQLDVDTVCVDNIDALWEIDLGDAWFAAVNEPPRYVNGHRTDYKPWGERYYNIGVAMFNLEQIRKDGMDNFLIHALNTEYLRYIDQDAWDKYGNTRAIDLPIRYNESMVTGYTDSPAIVHYAGYGNGWLDPNFTECPRLEHVKIYRKMSWEDALANRARAHHAGGSCYDTGGERVFQCSECGFGLSDIYIADESNFDPYPRFCQNCGAEVKI